MDFKQVFEYVMEINATNLAKWPYVSARVQYSLNKMSRPGKIKYPKKQLFIEWWNKPWHPAALLKEG